MSEVFSFPDADFPVPPEYREEYQERVCIGRKRMSQTTVVICGLARDVAWILPQTIARIERLGEMFADYRAVIYENDSCDQTKIVLNEWASRNPRADVTIEQCGDPVNPNARCLKRAERMARYRNACLEKVRACYSDFDHVIVVDTDLNHGWSNEGIANTFGHEGWDFVGSNGMIVRRCGVWLNARLQYDAWAFRQDEDFTPMSTAKVNYMSWQRGAPLVPVTCSFGGLGVYCMPAFLAGAYGGDDIEHVTHQKVARAKGFRNVYLNPSQITLYGRHHRRSDLWMFPLIQTVIKCFANVGIVSASQVDADYQASSVDADASSDDRDFDFLADPVADRNTVAFSDPRLRSRHCKRAILLTADGICANDRKNLTLSCDSSIGVLERYRSLLGRWGTVIPVVNPRVDLEQAAAVARARGLEPVHFSILPMQDLVLCRTTPNIVAPAWKLPNAPQGRFENRSPATWPAVASQCDSVLVPGPSWLRTLRSAGMNSPMQVVPIPIAEQYFSLPLWKPVATMTVHCAAFVLPQPKIVVPDNWRSLLPVSPRIPPKRALSRFKQFAVGLEEKIGAVRKRLFGKLLHTQIRRVERSLRAIRDLFRSDIKPLSFAVPYRRATRFHLSGVVYTTILNPADDQSGWRDLLSGFLQALGDRQDATLVLKLISSNPEAVEDVFDHYHQLGIPHRCRVVVITNSLSEIQLHDLIQSSTYYLQGSRAEGASASLRQFLAAGRPGISPCHSGNGDGFDQDVGFVIDSQPGSDVLSLESHVRLRSAGVRVAMPSLVEQLQASYEMAQSNPAAYQELATRARERLYDLSNEELVWNQLRDALNSAVTRGSKVVPTFVERRRSA